MIEDPPAVDLHAPLGLDRTASRRATNWSAIAFAGVGLLAASLIAFTFLVDDGMGGEPFAVARIEAPAPRPVQPPPVALPPAVAPPVAAPPSAGGASAQTVEGDSGVRVVRGGGAAAPGALVIEVPPSASVALSPAPDRRLVEKGRYGPLPRIGADGSRAQSVYARPFAPPPALAAAPRIAIVVGGMGLDAAATRAASAALPPGVTLAFAPYGANLGAQAAEARADGHEMLLQAPMEPFDAAATPGPHMLAVAATPEETRDALAWLMSRFSGYVGVGNFLGGRFLADKGALGPALREIAGRGLLFLDDGSAPQSLAMDIAPEAGLAAVRADLRLDADPSGAGLDAALTRLEALAREKGSAIGVVDGRPAALDRVARFAAGLEARGVALAPLSALAANAKPARNAAR